MTKNEVIEEIFHKTNINQTDIKVVIDAFIIEVKRVLAKGDSVTLRGFGTFKNVKRAEKNFHYSPGKYRLIPAHYEPILKFGKEVIEAVKEVKIKEGVSK